MSIATETQYTADDLLTLPDGKHFELVDGQLVEQAVSPISSWVEVRLLQSLSVHVDRQNLGWVFSSTQGFQCFSDDPNRVRRPDASFIRRERLPNGLPQRGHFRIAPDLAAEVISPNDLASDLYRKTGEYLAAGVRLVWIVDPETRSVTVHRADGTGARFGEQDELSGESVVPGFRCRIAELFPPR